MDPHQWPRKEHLCCLLKNFSFASQQPHVLNASRASSVRHAFYDIKCDMHGDTLVFFNPSFSRVPCVTVFRRFSGLAAQMKKCRARYGLEQQDQWCKPCRYEQTALRWPRAAAERCMQEGDGGAPSGRRAKLRRLLIFRARGCEMGPVLWFDVGIWCQDFLLT